MIDGLTGLGTALISIKPRRTIVVAPLGQPVAVVMADMDNFGSVNDRFGHLTGDEALRVVAACMQATCRIEDVVCRFAGEEFAISSPIHPPTAR